MVFRKCSIGGKVYEGDQETDETQLREKPADAPIEDVHEGEEIPVAQTTTSGDDVALTASGPPVNPKVAHFQDTQLFDDIKNTANGKTPTALARNLNAFMTTLALCHTALADLDEEDGTITYKAQSPDESALVQAAADGGYIFRGKVKDILKLQTPFTEGDSTEDYELLHVLDFTSARKRMSVIVRKIDQEQGNSRVFLLSKGADSVIIERLKSGQDGLVKTTEEHLEYFASSGEKGKN